MKRGAFTLPELLVVVSIIAVLLAILMPSINRAWMAAQFVNCQSNLRQLGVADSMYVNDNKGYLPFSNWNWDSNGVGSCSFCNAFTGWLYTCPIPAPLSNLQPSYVNTGVFYPYLTGTGVYHCPAQIIGDTGISTLSIADTMSSYLMNGAVNAYGAPNGVPISPLNLPPAYYLKITQFQSDDALMWEGAEAGANANNDGSTYPNESYNPSGPLGAGPQGARTRHGYSLSLLSIDGHVEAMRTQEYWTLASAPASTSNSTGVRNRLWCNPKTTDGHPPSGTYYP